MDVFVFGQSKVVRVGQRRENVARTSVLLRASQKLHRSSQTALTLTFSAFTTAWVFVSLAEAVDDIVKPSQKRGLPWATATTNCSAVQQDGKIILPMRREADRRPRVGVPWRTASEERAGRRRSYDHYLRAVREAGGEPVELSLLLSRAELKQKAESLDAVVLPGSAADVNPRRYGRRRHTQTAEPDRRREHTDDLLLDHALAADKPVLAICYVAQLLNVHLHGSLVQDIPSELHTRIKHGPSGNGAGARHPVRIEYGRLAELAGHANVRVNSSHHQSIRDSGRGLRVTAYASDGVVEAVEWIGGPGWIVGV